MKQTLDGETIYTVYGLDGTLLYRDNATTGEETDYIYLGASGPRLGRFDENAVFTWTHSDHLGSASLGVNAAGQAAWRESYTPFGEALQNPAANRDEAGFTGHIRDHATGLTYAQARYYNPVTARFLAPDPVGFADMGGDWRYFQRYAYTANDPANYTDAHGACFGPALVPCAVGGARLTLMGYRAFRGWRAGRAGAEAAAVGGALGALHSDADNGSGSQDEGGVRGRNVRPIDQPVDLPEQLAGEEILGEFEAGGGVDISGPMKDPRYDADTGTHDKLRGDHVHPDGTRTEVHGDRNRETGEISDVKFKDPPDNNRSRGPE